MLLALCGNDAEINIKRLKKKQKKELKRKDKNVTVVDIESETAPRRWKKRTMLIRVTYRRTIAAAANYA